MLYLPQLWLAVNYHSAHAGRSINAGMQSDRASLLPPNRKRYPLIIYR